MNQLEINAKTKGILQNIIDYAFGLATDDIKFNEFDVTKLSYLEKSLTDLWRFKIDENR